MFVSDFSNYFCLICLLSLINQENIDASEITMEHLKASIGNVEPSDIHTFQELSAKFQRLVSSDATEDVLVHQDRPRQSNRFHLW